MLALEWVLCNLVYLNHSINEQLRLRNFVAPRLVSDRTRAETPFNECSTNLEQITTPTMNRGTY